MMSISPQAGQPRDEMLSPSIQNAGQQPWNEGMAMRASILPYFHDARPWVFRRAEV